MPAGDFRLKSLVWLTLWNCFRTGGTWEGLQKRGKGTMIRKRNKNELIDVLFPG